MTACPKVSYTPLAHLLLTHAAYGGLDFSVEPHLTIDGVRQPLEAYRVCAVLLVGDLIAVAASQGRRLTSVLTGQAPQALPARIHRANGR